MDQFYLHLIDHELNLFTIFVGKVQDELKSFLTISTETKLIDQYILYLKLELTIINNRFELNTRSLELDHEQKTEIDKFILMINTTIEKIVSNLTYVKNNIETMNNLADTN